MAYYAVVKHTNYNGDVKSLYKRTNDNYNAYKAAAEQLGLNDADDLYNQAVQLTMALDRKKPASGTAFEEVKKFARDVLQHMVENRFPADALHMQVDQVAFLDGLRNKEE